MGKPRVLIFSTAYLPLLGGAEVAIKEITDRLVGQYDFEMITARLDPELLQKEKVGNVLVHRYGSKLTLALAGVLKVFSLKKFDLFWSVQASYASGPAYIYNILKKSVPIVLTLQEGELESKWRFGFVNLCWRLALPRTNYLTAISKYLLERARVFGYRGQASLVPNGVSESFFKVNKIKQDGLVLITTSRLVKKNAVGDIIQALKFLPDEVRLVIAGAGIQRSDLESLAQRSDLGARVQFLGHVKHADLPRYLGQADVFIRPSLSEGLGISFLEAMAVGLPVIATPVGGIPDFLKDGETGLFCQVNNPKSIAKQVQRLMNDKILYDKIIKNARELVKRNYTWDMISEKMGKIFYEQTT